MGGLGDAGLLAFSPVECLVGGMFIGVSVAARVFVVGHVTGISGIVCNALRHFHSIDKVLFTLGLFLAGLLQWFVSPSSWLALPAHLSLWRSAVAAVLVAAGTYVGNGCTSGHGICGLSRLSQRSMVAVATFMATGFLVSSLAGTAAALGVDAFSWTPLPAFAAGSVPLATSAAAAAVLLGLAAVIRARHSGVRAGSSGGAPLRAAGKHGATTGHGAGSGKIPAGPTEKLLPEDASDASDAGATKALTDAPVCTVRRKSAGSISPASSNPEDHKECECDEPDDPAVLLDSGINRALLHAFELTAGFVFGSGLVTAGMVNPAKVAAFLSANRLFDPSLMFVMGGAILVAAPAFQFVLRSMMPGGKRTLAASAFSLPTATHIDARLVLGAAAFGAGWGLMGICPGPAVTSLVRGEAWILVFCGVYAAVAAIMPTLDHRLKS